jgi:hypothetical protein
MHDASVNTIIISTVMLLNVCFLSKFFIVRNKPIYKTVQNYEHFLHWRSVTPDFNGFYAILGCIKVKSEE